MTTDNRLSPAGWKRAAAVYCILFAILYPAIFYARVKRVEYLSAVLIPFFVALVFLAATTGVLRNKRKSRWLTVAAFFFIMAGDWTINLTPFIKISAVTFSLTHILLGLSFLIDTGFRLKDLQMLLPVVIVSSAYFANNIIQVRVTGRAVILGIYLCFLSFMMWRALCYLRHGLPAKMTLCVITGSFLFYITDLLVCTMQIYSDSKYIISIWLCYPPALFLLSISRWFSPDCFDNAH